MCDRRGIGAGMPDRQARRAILAGACARRWRPGQVVVLGRPQLRLARAPGWAKIWSTGYSVPRYQMSSWLGLETMSVSTTQCAAAGREPHIQTRGQRGRAWGAGQCRAEGVGPAVLASRYA
jgi:hypothetical protein